jgi:hypothetical protein
MSNGVIPGKIVVRDQVLHRSSGSIVPNPREVQRDQNHQLTNIILVRFFLVVHLISIMRVELF